MTYRELKERLEQVDESLLDREINAYDNFLGDIFSIACEFDYNDIPQDIREMFAEDAGLIFIQLPKKRKIT